MLIFLLLRYRQRPEQRALIFLFITAECFSIVVILARAACRFEENEITSSHLRRRTNVPSWLFAAPREDGLPVGWDKDGDQ